MVGEREIDSLPDDLQNGADIRCLHAAHDPLAAVDLGREPPAGLLQQVQGHRLVAEIRPGLEPAARTRTPVQMAHMPRVAGTVTVTVTGVKPRPGRVEPSGGQQEIHRHRAADRFDEAVAVKVLVEPRPDPSDLAAAHKIDLVQDNHVGTGDLPELQPLLLGCAKDLAGIQHTQDAVQPKDVTVNRVQERDRDTRWIGDTAGLKDHVLGSFRHVHDAPYGIEKIITDRAADTPVRQADDRTLVHTYHEFGVDVQ